MTKSTDKMVPESIAQRQLDDYETVRAHGFSDHDLDTIKSHEHLSGRYPRLFRTNFLQEIIRGGWSPKISLLVAACFFYLFLANLSSPTTLGLGLAPLMLAAGIYNLLDIESDRLAVQMGMLSRLDSPIFRQAKFNGQRLFSLVGSLMLFGLLVLILGLVCAFFNLLSSPAEEGLLGLAGGIYLVYDVLFFLRQQNRRIAAKRIIALAMTLDVQEEPEPVRTPRQPVLPIKMLPLTPGVKLPGDQDDENF
jgi:hypothetical protein